MQTNKILKLMHAWFQSISIESIISTFSAADIVSQHGYLTQGTTVLSISLNRYI
jgi:hypothetical protein